MSHDITTLSLDISAVPAMLCRRCCSSQLLLFVKEGASGDLRTAVLEILQSKPGSDGSSSSEALAAQLEAAMQAARPAAADSLDGALAIGGVAGRLVNIVVGVAALQLVKSVSGTVLQQVSWIVEQRLWLHITAVACWLSTWAHEHVHARQTAGQHKLVQSQWACLATCCH